MNKVILASITLFATACSSPQKHYGHSHKYNQKKDSAPINEKTQLANVKDAIPKYEPKSKRGNPHKYTVFNKTYKVLSTSQNYKERGIASWYGRKFHGFTTSNGEIYDMYKMTAAHKTLPLPTYVKVTNLHNNRSIIVKLNDRGPFHDNRIIDLSYAAAIKLGFTNQGTAPVEVVAINTNNFHKHKEEPQITPTPLLNLQIGAFSNHSNALSAVAEISPLLANFNKKYKATISTTTTEQQCWHKVLIGPIDSEQELYLVKNFLSNTNFTQAFKN